MSLLQTIQFPHPHHHTHILEKQVGVNESPDSRSKQEGRSQEIVIFARKGDKYFIPQLDLLERQSCIHPRAGPT
jgi:hypothetical protein